MKNLSLNSANLVNIDIEGLSKAFKKKKRTSNFLNQLQQNHDMLA